MNAAYPRVETDPLLGATLADRYRVVRKLGEGGMGAVYEGEHLVIKKRVAIKVLHPQFATSPEVVARFHQEALAATAIGHEHIVEVNDMGRTADGALFMVLEFLAGRDFAHLLHEESPLPIARIVHIVAQICDAVQAAHDKGIVHRDLKPENVFLIKRGGDADWVKVLDFGISKIKSADGSSHAQTKTGSIIGTAYYMAPEQAMARKDIDHRADIWSIGVILYQALTGRFPFDQDAFPLLLISILQDVPEAPASLRNGIPEGLSALVMRCLEKLPEKRPASCSELATALGHFRDAVAGPTARDREFARTPSVGAQSLAFAATLPKGDGTYAPAGLSRPRWIVPSAMVLTTFAGGVGLYAATRAGTTPEQRPALAPARSQPTPAAPSLSPTPSSPPPAIREERTLGTLDFVVSPPTAVVLIDQHPIVPTSDGTIATAVRPDDIAIHELRIEARDYQSRVENLRLSYPQHIVVSLEPGSGVDDRRAQERTSRDRQRTSSQQQQTGSQTGTQNGTQTGTQTGSQTGSQTGTQQMSESPLSAEIRSDGVVVLPPGGALKRRPSH